MADWVELSVLTSEVGRHSKDDFGETLDQAGFLGLTDGGLFAGDQDWLDPDAFSPDDASERFAEAVWAELASRQQRLDRHRPGCFPFDMDDTYLIGEGSWGDHPAYTMLLLLDHGRTYAGVDTNVGSDSLEARLFEKIVQAGAVGLFGGPAVRFGWPIEPGWPTHPIERINHLADLLGLEPERLDTGEKVDPSDKDKGLDVVSAWTALDVGPNGGQPWVLLQCAAGANWKSKTGEPALSEWRDLLAWNGPLLKGVAIPWRNPDNWSITRVSRKFQSALVLERERLVRGRPDAHLDAETAAAIRAWCQVRIDELPLLR